MDDLIEAAEWSGIPKYQIERTMWLHKIDCPFIAAAYIDANSLAVLVKSNRHKWNLEWAKARVKERDN